MSSEFLQAVASSNLKKVGYDKNTGTLFVQFRKGNIWEYRHVPPETYDALVKASSIGRYFTKHVRDQFEAEEVGDEAALASRMRVMDAFRRDLEEQDRARQARREAVQRALREAAERSGRAVVRF